MRRAVTLATIAVVIGLSGSLPGAASGVGATPSSAHTHRVVVRPGRRARSGRPPGLDRCTGGDTARGVRRRLSGRRRRRHHRVLPDRGVPARVLDGRSTTRCSACADRADAAAGQGPLHRRSFGCPWPPPDAPGAAGPRPRRRAAVRRPVRRRAGGRCRRIGSGSAFYSCDHGRVYGPASGDGIDRARAPLVRARVRAAVTRDEPGDPPGADGVLRRHPQLDVSGSHRRGNAEHVARHARTVGATVPRFLAGSRPALPPRGARS